MFRKWPRNAEGEQYPISSIGGDNHHTNHAFDALFSQAEGHTEQACDTIVIGADVAHPLKTAAPGCPSIASVVGSVDDNFVKFPGSMRLQMVRRETIDKLWDMVKERLIDWAEARGGRLPKRILFYRDGVSESQYDKVIREEMTQIHKAFKFARAHFHPNDTCDESAEDEDDGDDFYREKVKGQDGDGDGQNLGEAPAKIEPIPHEPETMSQLQGMSLQDTAEITQDTSEQSVDQEEQSKAGRKELNKLEAWEIIKAGKTDFKLTYVVV